MELKLILKYKLIMLRPYIMHFFRMVWFGGNPMQVKRVFIIELVATKFILNSLVFGRKQTKIASTAVMAKAISPLLTSFQVGIPEPIMPVREEKFNLGES